MATVDEFFESVRMRTAIVPRLPGNNGDDLMVRGLMHTLERNGVCRVCRASKAEWVIVRGNGAMNDFWRTALDCVEYYSTHFPDCPLAVMPSSYHFTTTDLASVLAPRRARCILFAREQNSAQLLLSLRLPPGVEVALDHDMALRLESLPFVQRYRAWRRRHPQDYLLIVERCDVEHHCSQQALWRPGRFHVESPGEAAARTLLRGPRRAVLRARWRLCGKRGREPLSAGFATEVRQILTHEPAATRALRWFTGDISDPLKYSLPDFCRIIAGARIVVTTRLHVGLFASMLGVPTWLRTGRYGKIRGVYEYSLAHLSHVHLFGGDAPAQHSTLATGCAPDGPEAVEA